MEDTNQTVPEPSAPLSLIGRLTGVFATPGEVFDAVKAGPPATANWLVPALLFVAVSWVGAALVFSQPAVNRQITELQTQAVEKQIAAKKIPPQQAEAMRQAVEKFGSIGMKVSLVAAPLIAAFASPFWWGLLLWGLGKVVFKSPLGYMQAVEVTGLSNMILPLAALVQTLLVVGMGNPFVSPTPTLFLKTIDPTSPAFTVLSALNVFTFWVLALKAIGLSRLTGVSVGKAAAWVFGIWAGFTSLMVGFGLAAQALSKALQH